MYLITFTVRNSMFYSFIGCKNTRNKKNSQPLFYLKKSITFAPLLVKYKPINGQERVFIMLEK